MYSFPKSFIDLPDSLKKSYYQPTPETIIPGQIVTISKFFLPEICQQLISLFEQGITLETTPMRKSKEYAVRVNDRWSTTDFFLAQALWKYLSQILLAENEYGYVDPEIEALHEQFNLAIGLNPQLRVYRYRKGHHFGQHYDESVKCSVEEKGKKGTTKWTLLVYLTGDDDFIGGGTIFYPEIRGSKPLNIHPGKGMALLHKHGDDCMRHEGELVKDGVKWVLRSDVVF